MSVYIIQNIMLRKIVVQNRTFWTEFLNANKKDALCLATTES